MKRNHRGRPGRQRVQHPEAEITREFQQWYHLVDLETLPRHAWVGPFNYYKAMRASGVSHTDMLKQARQPLYKHEASDDLPVAGF